jgi:lipopolysaccharide O-acetyltransferase
LAGYRLAQRGWAKLFSLSIAGSFESFGSRTVIQPPVRLAGERRIAIGRDVFIGAGSWLQALDDEEGDGGVAIELGDGTSIAGSCVISAVRSVRLGPRVLVARGVYISDHSHAFEDVQQAVLDQGVTEIRPVEVGEGAWLSENVVVCPGVRIGRGAVVGANSVVLDDVPDHCVAVGAPAKVARRLGSGSENA